MYRVVLLLAIFVAVAQAFVAPANRGKFLERNPFAVVSPTILFCLEVL